MSGTVYKPALDEDDDFVACGPSSPNTEVWWDEFPEEILWLGESLFYRIQALAANLGCALLPSFNQYEWYYFDEAKSQRLLAEVEIVFGSNGDEHVREGARLLMECVQRYLYNPVGRVFNVEGP